MLSAPTLEQLQALRLTAMAAALAGLRNPPEVHALRHPTPAFVLDQRVPVDTFQVILPHTGLGPYTVTLPPQFVATLGSGPHGFEVLAIEHGGNQTITEGSFTLP